MSESRVAVIWADAGPSIGGGHVMRCLSLATELVRRGWRCAVASRAGTRAAISGIARWDDWREFPGAGPAPWQLDEWLPAGCDLLVVDGYGLDCTYEQACRPWARHLLVIDDLIGRHHDCDLLLDPTLGRRPEPYAGTVPSGCGLLLGPDYALLRPEFAQLRAASLERRRQVRPVENVLVNLGAGDVARVTGIVLEGIRHSGLRPAVEVVVGGAGIPDVALAGYDFPVTTIAPLAGMAELMVRADLAIGAAGSSSWERCRLGLPSISTVIADNQRDIADALAGRGATLHVGMLDQLTPEKVGAAFLTLAGNPSTFMR